MTPNLSDSQNKDWFPSCPVCPYICGSAAALLWVDLSVGGMASICIIATLQSRAGKENKVKFQTSSLSLLLDVVCGHVAAAQSKAHGHT